MCMCVYKHAHVWWIEVRKVNRVSLLHLQGDIITYHSLPLLLFAHHSSWPCTCMLTRNAEPTLSCLWSPTVCQASAPWDYSDYWHFFSFYRLSSWVFIFALLCGAAILLQSGNMEVSEKLRKHMNLKAQTEATPLFLKTCTNKIHIFNDLNSSEAKRTSAHSQIYV